MENTNDNIRQPYRFNTTKVKPKKKVYTNIDFYLDISENVIADDEHFEQIKEMDRDAQLKFLCAYLYDKEIKQSELIQFGDQFPFEMFLQFILTNDNEDQNFIALKILAQSTRSGKADYKFYYNPQLLELCDSLIKDPKYTLYILKILIFGSEYEDFGVKILEENICDFLLILSKNDNQQIIQHVSMLVCNLTWFVSNHLAILLEILSNILNDQLSKIETISDYSIFCYSFKSIHHIYNWEEIDNSIIDEINENFTPIFYKMAPLFFDTDARVLNTILRYLSHLDDVPVEFGALILESISNDMFLKYKDKIKNGKTIKLAMIPFIYNRDTWIQEYQEDLLVLAFSEFENISYDAKLIVFDALLAYYQCTENVVDQFMHSMIDWCMTFITDKECTAKTLEKLIEIAFAIKSDSDVIASISSNMDFYEELLVSDKSDEDEIYLAEKLIEILNGEEE